MIQGVPALLLLLHATLFSLISDGAVSAGQASISPSWPRITVAAPEPMEVELALDEGEIAWRGDRAVGSLHDVRNAAELVKAQKGAAGTLRRTSQGAGVFRAEAPLPWGRGRTRGVVPTRARTHATDASIFHTAGDPSSTTERDGPLRHRSCGPRGLDRARPRQHRRGAPSGSAPPPHTPHDVCGAGGGAGCARHRTRARPGAPRPTASPTPA